MSSAKQTTQLQHTEDNYPTALTGWISLVPDCLLSVADDLSF